MQQTDANHCTTACTTTKGNDPRVVQPKTSIVCELHCLPAGFEHGRRACHIHAVWCMRYSCVHACSTARGFAWDTKRVQREQSARHRALPPTLPRRGCRRCSRRRAEGEAAAQLLKQFSSRLAQCNVRPPPAVHCRVRFALPCDAEARREPSIAVRRISRIV